MWGLKHAARGGEGGLLLQGLHWREHIQAETQWHEPYMLVTMEPLHWGVLLYQKKRGQRELERKNEREKKREDGVFIHPSQKANRGGGGYCLGTPLDGVKGQKFKDSLCWYQQMSYATVSASETKQNKIFPSFSAPGSASRTSFCVCVYIMCIYHILIFHIYIIYCLNICLDIR